MVDVVAGGAPQSLEQEVVVSPDSHVPLPHTEAGVEFTHAVPLQYCPLGHVVVVPVPDCGELQHAPLYQYHPEDAQIDASKQLAAVLHPEEVVLVAHAVPFQYCPEGHVVDVVDVTHAVPLQYCPLGQSVDVVVLQ